MIRAFLAVALFTVAVSTNAHAQDDDDLVPLAPLAKPKPKIKPKPRPALKAKPPLKPSVSVPDDELVPIAPIVSRGELTVKLASPLSGCILSIDGKEIGSLPVAPQQVYSGEHSVMVKRPGYAAFVKKVQVFGGRHVEVEAKLIAIAAVLSVTSDVPTAQVFLNGKALGSTPLNAVEVPAGVGEVVVFKEGLGEQTQRVNFVLGNDYPVTVKFKPASLAATDRPLDSSLVPTSTGGSSLTEVSLKPATPITSRWYFWAGIAAGAVAIAVGVGAGVVANSAAQERAHQKHLDDLCFSFSTCAGVF